MQTFVETALGEDFKAEKAVDEATEKLNKSLREFAAEYTYVKVASLSSTMSESPETENSFRYYTFTITVVLEFE